MSALSAIIPPAFQVSQEQFEKLAIANRDLRLERTATGELIIMPPTGGNTGKRNIAISALLWLWNQQTGLGVTFDSSTAFILPNGATRSPDAAWVRLERWDLLTPEEQETFPPLCPDFAIELRSKTDTMRSLRAKMQEYLDNGLLLGWLLDPQSHTVEIYRRDRPVEICQDCDRLSGEEILPDFVVNLNNIWG
ncbi:MAG: Uma2 family endonuclease [Cyanobacteria bacterium SBLK]|nr:Uma2 family endonuclease [Cyanobacteria bacterium SBLK]